MVELIAFSFINGFSLAIGAILGTFIKFSQRTVAAFMAFGSGILICALTFGLMEEAFAHGGYDAVIVGFPIGGLLFIGIDWAVHYWGGRKHRRHQHSQARRDTNGLMITIGAVLDGIPEAIALGITLFTNKTVGLMMVSAIAFSNFPESISSINGLKKEGFGRYNIISIWAAVGILVALATVFSFYFLHNLDFNTLGILESLAAGAILAMLASSMMPEAYEDGGYSIGLMTILGFLVAFIISRA